MRKPNFFIVGAAKSGTAALDYYLNQHPDIFIPELKEPNYFGSDIPPMKDWYENENEYLLWFSKARGEKRIGEATVRYLYSQRAAPEIKKFSPNASIIIMLRNPVDMMYSLHSQLLFEGTQDVLDFEAALEAERKIKKYTPEWKEARKNLLLYRDVASFYKQVKRFLDVFGTKKVHIIIFDEFVKDTPKAYAKVLSFLGVDNNFKINFKKFNSESVKNSNKVPRIRFFQKALNHSPLIFYKILRLIVPREIRYYLYCQLEKINMKYQPRRKLSPGLRKKLQKEFEPEIKRLEKLIHKDLSYWYNSQIVCVWDAHKKLSKIILL